MPSDAEAASLDPRAPSAFLEVLHHFDQAMLVTLRGGELRSRPMAIVDRTPHGHVWFITSLASGKLDELSTQPHVNVAMQQESRFLSISGTARLTRERHRIDEVWQTQHAVWFEEGRDDPRIVLIEVVPIYAEYWDRSGLEGLKFAFEMVRSLVTGEQPKDDAALHGKLPFAGAVAAE
jgi:general stress protein 26